MKKLLLIILLTSCLSPLTFSQWWVRGGNLIWPYGNVDITKGNLNLTGDLKTTGNMDLKVSSQLYIRDAQGNRMGVISGSPGGDLSIALGDVDGANQNIKLTIDDNEVFTSNLRTDILSLPNIVVLANVSDPPTDVELDLVDLGPEGSIKIIDDSDSSKYFLVYKLSFGFYLFVEIKRA